MASPNFKGGGPPIIVSLVVGLRYFLSMDSLFHRQPETTDRLWSL